MNRQKRTPANPGRANINIGGFMGAGGLEGGVSPVAEGAASAASTLSPEMGSAIQANVAAANTGGLNPYATQSFTPYTASGWQNLISRGQAGMQANALNNQYYTTQLAGQNALATQNLQNIGAMDLARLQGSNAIDLAKLQGQNQIANTQAANQGAIDLSNRQAILNYASKLGVHPDSASQAMSQLDPTQIAMLKQQLENGLGLAKLTGQVQSTPEFASTFGAGMNARNISPVADNLAKSTVLGPNQVSFGYGSDVNPTFTLGPKEGAKSVTTSEKFDPQTFQKTQTVTTSGNYSNPQQMRISPNGKPMIQMPPPTITDNSTTQQVTPVINPYPTRQMMPGNFASPIGGNDSTPSSVGGNNANDPFASFNPNASAIDTFTQQQQEQEKLNTILKLFGQQQRY